MRNILFIVLLFNVSILAYSCSNDTDEKMDLTTSLKQTSWTGTYRTGEGENEKKASVGLVFYTEKEGYCDLMFNEKEYYRDNFNYTADGKLLVIVGSGAEGNWMLVSKDKNKMILEKGTGGNPSLRVQMLLTQENK